MIAHSAEELHMLGLVAYQRGEREQAAAILGEAARLAPRSAVVHSNLGVMLQALGRLPEALASCRTAVALQPSLAEAHNNLASVLRDVGQPGEAAASCQRALAINPELAGAYLTLGNLLQDEGKPSQAVAAYARALELSPDNPEARLALATAHVNAGAACQAGQEYEQAVFHYRQAETLDPENLAAQLNLSVALRLQGRVDEALASSERALQLDPNHFGAHLNRGIALEDLGRVNDAVASYQRAVQLDPAVRDAHLRLALAALRGGDFERGWREYEWRWETWDMPGPKPAFAQPEWDGSPLDGRSLLLYAEQGFGDTLQFVRYVPLIQATGGDVILQCRPELKRLLAESLSGVRVIGTTEPLPGFDVQAALLSCPGLMATTLDSIPANVPYLKANARRAARWHKRLAGDRLKVGLVWASSSPGLAARRRSLSPEALRPLAGISGVQLFALQKGASDGQPAEIPAGMPITDLGSELADFADTAAVISELDLVISIDTSVAHLAGGLGRPVWVLLPFVSDWRWLLEREDSPWYPTMRLFRQEQPDDWQSAIARIISCLETETGR